MKISALPVASAVFLVGSVVFVLNCGKDDPQQGEPARLARKGEACQTTNDCTQGLACLPNGSGGGGSCVVGVFNVAVTAKECKIIECSTVADCCNLPTSTQSQCASLKSQCDAQPDSGFNTGICDEYKSLCVCDTQQLDCQNGQCVSKCLNDSACGSGRKCVGGVCSACVSDTDCATSGSPDQVCVNGQCKDKCQGDGDCPGFDRCIGGKCVEGGCQSDRECIAAYRNVEATCGTDGQCIVPCQTDLECGNPKSYNFFSCIGGKCLYTGCGTDKDCELALCGATVVQQLPTSSGGTSGSSSNACGGLTSKQHVVCKDKAVPNATTKSP